MDFTNERYVCLYVRDTTTWKRLPWPSRMILPNILRKLDRSGLMELEGMTAAACVALHLEVPLEFVAEALPPLFRPMDPNDASTAILTLTPTAIFWPRFRDGQDSTKSDKQRQRESRENRAMKARLAGRPATQEELFVMEQSRIVTDPAELGLPRQVSQVVTKRQPDSDPSHSVTELASDSGSCHANARAVTPAEPSEPSLLGLTEPGCAESHSSNVVTFRRPLPPEPPDIAPARPPLWRQILKWHADAFAEALAGLSPPRHAKRDEAARKLAQWCEDSAAAYRTTPEALGQRVVDGLFRSHRASQSRFPIGFAANDPAEYLPLPPGAKPPPKPSQKSTHNPAPASQTYTTDALDLVPDAHLEAAQ